MTRVNESLAQMHESYLFSEVAKRAAAFSRESEGRLLRLGIGDVTRPVAPCCVAAMKRAADEMGEAATFRGYPPGTGEPFVKRAILRTEYGRSRRIQSRFGQEPHLRARGPAHRGRGRSPRHGLRPQEGHLYEYRSRCGPDRFRRFDDGQAVFRDDAPAAGRNSHR